MAMTMTGEVALPTDRIGVGARPDDPEILAEILPRIPPEALGASVPGRPSLGGTGDASFATPAKIGIATACEAFDDKVELCEIAPAPAWRIPGMSGSFADGAVVAIFAAAAIRTPASTRS